MTIARLGLLGLGRLEQHNITVEQARHAAHEAVREPQEDQRNAHQPEDRQCHPQKANRNPAHAEEWAEWSRRRTCPRHGIFQLSDCDLVEDESERQRRDQVNHKMASEIRQPIGREGQLERKLEKEDRANRQIGPGEELVLPDREACCRCLLQNNLARDQGKENQDQDKNGVFQDGNKLPAKKALHPQGQQFFLPRAADPPRQPLDAPRLAAKASERRLLQLVAGMIGCSTLVDPDSCGVSPVLEISVPLFARCAARRQEMARRSRSSRINFNRVTARRSGISSRNASVSPTSSAAVRTMRSHDSSRLARSSALIRSNASSASWVRRRSSAASLLIGLAANTGNPGSGPVDLEIRSPGRLAA